MLSRDFAFWLQGFFEISKAETINKEQTEMIKKHLSLVFFHEIDPTYTNDPKKQEQMNDIHSNIHPYSKPSNTLSPNTSVGIMRC